MHKRTLLVIVLLVVVVWSASAYCEDCDTAARHFLRELFRAAF